MQYSNSYSCDFGNTAEIICICKDCRGNRVGGGEYELCKCNKPIDRKRANSRGECRFCGLLPGEYTVREVDPPCGFHPNSDRVTCIVRRCVCCMFESCRKAPRLRVYDDSGLITSFDDFEMDAKDCGCGYYR